MSKNKSTATIDYTKFTYTLKAESCEQPKILYERTKLTMNEAQKLARILEDAFRDIEIICDDTGEVCINKYYSDAFFPKSALSYSTVISRAEMELEMLRKLDEINAKKEEA